MFFMLITSLIFVNKQSSSIAFVEGNYFFVKQPWFLGIILPWCAVYLWKKYKVVVVKTQCSQDLNAVKRS